MGERGRRLAEQRHAAPVQELAPGVVFVSSHRHAVRVLGDAGAFTCVHADAPPGPARTLLQADSEAHGVRRRLMGIALSSDRIARLEPLATRVAGDLVETLACRRRAELVGDLADPLTSAVVGDLVTVPTEERARIFGLTATLLYQQQVRAQAPWAGASPEALSFRNWALAQRAQRETEPDAFDDALSMLARPDPVTGRRLTEDEFVVDARNLCQAAMGSTRRLIANLFYELARHPVRYGKLWTEVTPVCAVIEESLRHDPPNLLARRTCTRQTELDDVSIRAGDVVLVSLESANRDERRYERGDEFDLGRTDRRPHMAFGWGAHRCPGATLARMIAATALRAFVGRISSLTLSPSFVYERQAGLDAFRWNGPRHLDVLIARSQEKVAEASSQSASPGVV